MVDGVAGLVLVAPAYEILGAAFAGLESRDTTAIDFLALQRGIPFRILHAHGTGENGGGNACEPRTPDSSLAVPERFPDGRAAQGHVHPHAFMGFHILHVTADCPMLPMLVETGTPPVAQPVHDTFRITSPHTIPIRVQAEEHTAPRMPDFQDSYFLTHAYNDTILLSNQQYEKACRPGIEIPGLHAKNRQ